MQTRRLTQLNPTQLDLRNKTKIRPNPIRPNSTQHVDGPDPCVTPGITGNPHYDTRSLIRLWRDSDLPGVTEQINT